MPPESQRIFADAVRCELNEHLLAFWLDHAVDEARGGFIGQMSNDGTVDPQAPKGLILNARLLWTFSAAYRFNEDPRCRELAERAIGYLEQHFWDATNGGAFWLLDCAGHVLDDKKKIYGQAFCIYALAEQYQAFGTGAALQHAQQLFNLIEIHSRDRKDGGYIEVCNRDWSPAEDSRLSDKDMDTQKSMNNHLHLLEAYTNLYRIWPDAALREGLAELLDLFERRIADPDTGHLHHFFDSAWQRQSADYTFGHDIEASWLLCEAAKVLGDAELTSRAQQLALRLAQTTLAEGLDQDGGLFYAGQTGEITDPNREWWPQAEAIVGFLNAYALAKDEAFLDAAQQTWDYIEKHFIDEEHGEWFWRVRPDGTPDPDEPKVSQWKSPYHNVRACLEILRRLAQLA
ncbi:MAG: AGE family epimerase/isomerase [Phycisphaerales bacterium]|nr:MAG: AGE family epimerase/isomerase [Phycisphaerales bacterium]